MAGVLGAWHLVWQLVADRVDLLGRFDDGIEFTTVTYLLHGQLPITDFYEPYGIGLGFPGALAHLLGFGSAMDMRITYSLFPPLVTLLVVPLVWRRAGGMVALLVGLVSLVSNTPRYSMGFCALFAFVLIVDMGMRHAGTTSLQDFADWRPRILCAAAAVLSLAGWARVEYLVFAAVWAALLVLVLRGRQRWLQAGWAAACALLPTLIVIITGGATQLGWIIRYNLSTSSSGFGAQRGQPIEWSLVHQRLSQLWNLQLSSGDPGAIVASYGVGLAVVAAGVAVLLVPTWRRRFCTADRSYLSLFMLMVCAFVLYAQAVRFSSTYGMIGAPVFWTAGTMLWRRVPTSALAAITLLIAYPLFPGISPGGVQARWDGRPRTPAVPVPGLGDIPVANDDGAPSMSVLIRIWRQLKFTGRPTLSVERRNDVAWGNDAIVGFLLNAPAAAWPLTYDPGLVNQPDVQRATVLQLCADHAPVVQLNGDYPYPPGVPVYIGSRLLDQFLALSYHVRAVAGFYRILVPSGPRCLLPAQVTTAQLQADRNRLMTENELPAAGAIGIALLDRAVRRHVRLDPADAAVAVLGGYTLLPDEVPATGPPVDLLEGTAAARVLTAAATRQWPDDFETLAVQEAWVQHRSPSEPGQGAAAQAILHLALRHANWPTAIGDVAAVIPPTPGLFRTLAAHGAAGPIFDTWRYNTFARAHQTNSAIAAGAALIADYRRSDDPSDAAAAELELAALPGLQPACAELLRFIAYRDLGTSIQLPASRCADPVISRAAQ